MQINRMRHIFVNIHFLGLRIFYHALYILGTIKMFNFDISIREI